MKYLYQQLLAFWIVIFTILIIIGSSFTLFTRQTMLDSTYDQLSGYGESIDNALSIDLEVGYNHLQVAESVLNAQGVTFTYIDGDKNIIYPTDSDVKVSNILSSEDWEKLKSGSQQKITHTKSTTPTGEKTNTAYVIVPRFSWKDNQVEGFYGALVISQPIKAVDTTMSSLMDNLKKGFLISSIVAIIISYFFAKFQLSRINNLRKATRQIATGDFDVHLETKEKDEFDDLAEDFNAMTEALKESQLEIERQEERRKKFMADAAHEMKTPLTTISGLLEGITHHAIPENQQENALKLMQNETERLIRLVTENLDYEKIRTNQISIVVKRFNATETLAHLVEQMQTQAKGAGDTLTLETTESIDVYADYDRFMQIMVNIIRNAIQFTTDGSIKVTIEKGYLETIIKVSDTGIGMSEDDLRNIWDRYFKVDPSRTSTEYGESGLGLSIVQQLVKLHKGHIDVESKEGEGTTFSISFPDVEIKDE